MYKKEKIEAALKATEKIVSRNNFYDWRLEACLYFSLIHCSLLEVVYTILQFSFNMKMLFFPPTMANKWKKRLLVVVHSFS